MSVQQLASHCGTSKATIYRRIETLREHKLVAEKMVPDEDGHHYKVYQTNVDSIRVNVSETGFEVEVDRRETMADRLTQFIEDI